MKYNIKDKIIMKLFKNTFKKYRIIVVNSIIKEQ